MATASTRGTNTNTNTNTNPNTNPNRPATGRSHVGRYRLTVVRIVQYRPALNQVMRAFNNFRAGEYTSPSESTAAHLSATAPLQRPQSDVSSVEESSSPSCHLTTISPSPDTIFIQHQQTAPLGLHHPPSSTFQHTQHLPSSHHHPLVQFSHPLTKDMYSPVLQTATTSSSGCPSSSATSFYGAARDVPSTPASRGHVCPLAISQRRCGSVNTQALNLIDGVKGDNSRVPIRPRHRHKHPHRPSPRPERYAGETTHGVLMVPSLPPLPLRSPMTSDEFKKPLNVWAEDNDRRRDRRSQAVQQAFGAVHVGLPSPGSTVDQHAPTLARPDHTSSLGPATHNSRDALIVAGGLGIYEPYNSETPSTHPQSQQSTRRDSAQFFAPDPRASRVHAHNSRRHDAADFDVSSIVSSDVSSTLTVPAATKSSSQSNRKPPPVKIHFVRRKPVPKAAQQERDPMVFSQRTSSTTATSTTPIESVLTSISQPSYQLGPLDSQPAVAPVSISRASSADNLRSSPGHSAPPSGDSPSLTVTKLSEPLAEFEKRFHDFLLLLTKEPFRRPLVFDGEWRLKTLVKRMWHSGQ